MRGENILQSEKTKNNKKTLFEITIMVVIILIISSIFVYNKFFVKEETIQIEEEKFQIDDRISPLENQGLILEVLRIRHRGLYDKLMSWGNSWKTKPTYYWITVLDGVEYKSKDVEHLGHVTETLINSWDTMFQENKIVRDVEEEQETSEIKLTLIEIFKTGLFKRKTEEVERDSITLTYDYRTGRWQGDDYVGDYDGYGHYLGETFEIWFNVYQMDYDADSIPYWTEVNILGTDPMRSDAEKDPDNDGIPTVWEWKWGYDPFTWDDHEKLDPDIDGVENIEEYETSRWLSDPYTQDVYCEIDYMGKGPRLLDKPHVFWEEGMQAITEKYAEHNIKLYFDMGWPDTPKNGGGDILPHYTGFSQDSGMILQFYNHYFPDERKGVFRYVVMGHGGPFNHPSKYNIYDSIHAGYHVSTLIDRIKWMAQGIIPTERGIIKTVSSTLMHELGHSIGIHPWTFEGCDNLSYLDGREGRKEYEKTWGTNYWSTMNYYTMYNMKLLDYSDGSNGPPYDQNDWLKLFVATFQYNSELIEEIFFEPPGLDKVVYGETETGVTGYTYDKNLTEKFIKNIGDWSPVNPINVNWLVFKLEDKNKYPYYREVKVLVQPKDVPCAGWAEYAGGELDSKGDMQFYSQETIFDNVLEKLK